MFSSISWNRCANISIKSICTLIILKRQAICDWALQMSIFHKHQSVWSIENKWTRFNVRKFYGQFFSKINVKHFFLRFFSTKVITRVEILKCLEIILKGCRAMYGHKYIFRYYWIRIRKLIFNLMNIFCFKITFLIFWAFKSFWCFWKQKMNL